MRIVVAMSGGVDSSTAAALLCEQGHEVIGVAMKTHSLAPKSNRACCTPDDMRDARRVADKLGIPFYVLAYEDVFAKEVIEPFAAAYRAGRTPNPCVACNDKVKFAPLLQRARLLGADKLATGHYARLAHDAATGEHRLLRAVDAQKDQTYFLYRLRQEQLQMLHFPLGDMCKDEVRSHARRLGLGGDVADKAESQEICFVGPKGYAATVEAHSAAPEGSRNNVFVDAKGQVLGQHPGVHHFTLGQRRGLQLAHPSPLYVTDIDAASGQVRLGDKDALLCESARLEELSWTQGAPAVGDALGLQQRHRGTPADVIVTACDAHSVSVRFVEPQPRAAPGQAGVLFRGDAVVGGGTLQRQPEAQAAKQQPHPGDAVPAAATL